MVYGYTPTPAGGGPGETTRKTQTMGSSHTYNLGGMIDYWEANIIIYDDPVSLQRDTWASIKTSF